METKQCYLLAIGFNMTVIWGYLKFCWFMSDFDKYECYNLPRSPLSNLTFISKLTERVVLKRLSNHMHHNNLNIPNQHGYKKNHSTETILLINDIRINFDKSNATILLLFDLSAAFDTVSVDILLNILSVKIGVFQHKLKQT